MPELPEVEIFKEYIDSTSLNKKIKGLEIENPEIILNVSPKKLQKTLLGHKFIKTRRHGKYLFLKLNNGFWFILHFGMTGNIKYFQEMNEEPAYTCLILHFSNGFHLAYHDQRKFGKLGLTNDVEGFINKKELGPDALEINFTSFKNILKRRRGTLKYTLMNQKIIAGIGNMYADEILFQAGLHPQTRSNKLNEKSLKNLFEVMRKVLKTVVRSYQNSIKLPEFYLTPHRIKGDLCPGSCGKMEKMKIAGRTTYFCPRCQRKVE